MYNYFKVQQMIAEKSFKTFIGGLVIGSIIGGVVAYILSLNWFLNIIS